MNILFRSLFFPYLTYCVEIWGNTYPININGIFLLKKKSYPHYVWYPTFGSGEFTFSTIACLNISIYYRTEDVIIYIQSLLPLSDMYYPIFPHSMLNKKKTENEIEYSYYSRQADDYIYTL